MGKKKQNNEFLIYFGWYLAKAAETVFVVSVLSFAVYFFLESLKVGLISNHFNLNLLPAIALFSGLVSLIFNDQKEKKNKFKSGYYFIFIPAALLIFILSYQHLQNLKLMSYWVAVVAGIVFFLALRLFAKNNNYDD